MEQVTQGHDLLATAPVGRLIFRFAVPSITSMLVNALYNIVDQMFIGRDAGYLGNGAANVVGLVSLCAIAIAMLLGDGAAAYASLSLGAGKQERAASGASGCLVLAGAAGLGVMTVCQLFLQPALRLFGCTELLLPMAMEYGRVIVFGLPLMMVSMALNSLIRADGSPGYAMLSVIAGTLLNGVLDPLLIFGLGWGIRGAAIATCAGQGVSFIISLAYLGRFRRIRIGWRRTSALHPRIVWECCALGVSSFIDQGAFVLVMAVSNQLILTYGALSPYGREIPLAAFGLSMKVQEILFTILMGIALGMQPVAGYNYGAGNIRRVRQAYRTACLAGTIVSMLSVVLFLGWPDLVIGLFGSADNQVYMEFSRKFFRTYFLLYVFFGFQTITGVFFQSIGRAGKAAALSLTYQLVFKILFAVLLCKALGLDGVLWSGPLADFLICLITCFLVVRQMRALGMKERRAQY